MDLLYKTTAFLLLGLCSCQNKVLDGPLNRAVGESVVFQLINPPAQPPQSINWGFRGHREVTIFLSIGDVELPHSEYAARISVNKATASLELRNLTLMDTGEYALSITISGTQQRETTSLGVFEKISTSPIISTGGTLITGNSSVNLTCDAQGTIITREWTKDGKPLSPSNSTTFLEENRTLSINPVEKEDNGQYTCTVSNPISSVSENYNLVVNYGPLSVHIGPSHEVTSGDRVSLDCSADSVPTASFTWMFNKTQIGDKSQLVIERVDQSHAGMYTCTAWNSITALGLSGEHMLRVNEKIPGPSSILSPGAIAGIVIGVIIILAAVSGVTFYFVKKKGKMGAPKPHQARGNNGSVELNYADISHFQRKTVKTVDQGNGGNGETLYSGVRLPSSPAGPNSGQGPTYADLNFPRNAVGMRANSGNAGDQNTVYAQVRP